MFNVLIVEDDFRVAAINEEQIEKIEGFHVVHIANNTAEAIAFLDDGSDMLDIILLDVYIPDSPSLQLFWQLRKDYPLIDIVMITAATETKTITEVLHGGIFDYLIKPVDFERFEQTFVRYRTLKFILSKKKELSQIEFDTLFQTTERRVNREESKDGLPKGIDKLTLDRIESVLQQSAVEGMTAVDVGEASGVSRSTARRYLEYLLVVERAKALLNYGDVGRPERTYISLEL